ncbi:MAG: DUF1223 domain-containing protein [Gammaproteobacteria bacterium]
MPRTISLFAAILLAFFGAAQVAAQEDAAAAAEDSDARPVVLLELFTSQGCYSCPPAEELLAAEYAPRDDILPLELHVDYWDDLIYGLAGSWEDPFSQNAFSERQFAYNRRIVGRNGGVTPQFIIHGKIASSGSHKGRIDAAIAKVQNPATDDDAADDVADDNWFSRFMTALFGVEKTQDAAQYAGDDNVRWHFENDEEGKWRAQVRGTLQPGGDLYYAVFRRRVITEVPSGENKGKTLTNTNVVLVLQNRPLSAGRELALPKLKEGEDCAVWVQNGGGGVVAAARCPQQSS